MGRSRPGPGTGSVSFAAHLLARGQNKSWEPHRFTVGKLDPTSDVDSCPVTA